jgi:hypothetical protein
VVTQASIGWGNVYSSVYGAAGTATGNASGVSISGGGRRYGAAIMTGDKGEVLDCEYLVGFNGHGTGACKDNHGAKYRLMF